VDELGKGKPREGQVTFAAVIRGGTGTYTKEEHRRRHWIAGKYSNPQQRME
jgi:hypothetical protein